MGLEVDYGSKHKPNSTPKLPLSKPPLMKPSEPIQMLTPPLHQSLSVPFRWEVEARSSTNDAVTCSTATATRRLDLPPRLMLNDDSEKISIMPSPVTVLDGPYVGRSLSLACTFSFRKCVATTGREEGARLEKRGGARNLGSGRSLRDAFKNEKRLERRSFFNLSGIKSNIWADICSRFRHAVPWRRS